MYGEPFLEFTYANDYLTYVDGKPGYKGVSSFLESRGIKIPFGEAGDVPGSETVCGLGNDKNEAFNDVIKNEGVEVFSSTIGVQAGAKGKFGLVLGIARENNAAELQQNGADFVVSDLSEIKNLRELQALFLKYSGK